MDRAALRPNGLKPLASNAALLRPIVRAYLFGHLSSTGPRILSALLSIRTQYRDPSRLISRLSRIIAQSLGTDRFPFFCGHLAALYITLRTAILAAVSRREYRDAQQARLYVRLSAFVAAAIASWVSLPLVNGRSRRAPRATLSAPAKPVNGYAQDNAAFQASAKQPQEMAGKTLDLTLLASVRAVETLIHHGWTRYHGPRAGQSTARARVERVVARAADPAVFISSCFVIMWAWFYEPERLPHGYSKWITSAAEVDMRLIEALRGCRKGTFLYGKETGAAHILTPMAREHGWPEVWGDPARTMPVPCEMVHHGLAGSSCHAYGLARFARAFRFSFVTYLPLQLILRLRKRPQEQTAQKLVRAVQEAARSSAFLGGFIALFYYAVCCARTVVGPRLFPHVSLQAWDSGLCTAAGCAACGWSVLLEPPRRRAELAGFVAPRALAAVLPRRYPRTLFPRERAAFALSMGVLLASIQDGPEGVRGVLGQLLSGILG